MICYTLACAAEHRFDSWFNSAEAFDALQGAGHVTCPVCGSRQVEKTLMAPSVTTREAPVKLTKPENETERKLAELKRHVEENSDYVGMNFASEARRIHQGEVPERSIYGEAKPDEAIALIEDGIPVAPLPFLPPRKAN